MELIENGQKIADYIADSMIFLQFSGKIAGP